jgi:immunoglobulin-binding protein 1
MEALRGVLVASARGHDDPPPLAVLWARANAVHTHQDALLASRNAEAIGAALELIERAQNAAEAAGLFSANEDEEDLATADIKYLLLPFYQGSLLAAAPATPTAPSEGGTATSPAAARLASVQRAQPALGVFLHR